MLGALHVYNKRKVYIFVVQVRKSPITAIHRKTSLPPLSCMESLPDLSTSASSVSLAAAAACDMEWSEKDKGRSIVLSPDRRTVTFHPRRSIGCSAVRGTKQLHQNLEHFFEVELREPFFGHARMIGMGTCHTPLQSQQMDYYPLLGRDACSWALNYKGQIYHQGDCRDYLDIDTDKLSVLHLGLHYDAYYGTITFCIDGVPQGVAYSDVNTALELYPMIGATSFNCIMKLTRSHSCVLSLKALCRGVIRELVSSEDLASLPLPPHMQAFLAFKDHHLKTSPTASSLDSILRESQI